MKKVIFSIILLVVFSLPLFAQTPVLIDEFPKINLEDLLSRLDYLTSELIKSENSTALIKVYGGKLGAAAR